MNEIEKNSRIVATVSTQSLIQDLRQIIEQARGHVAATANYELTMMYWHIGERINREVLDNQRAEYGKQIVAQVARQLQTEFDIRGLDEKNVRRMKQFVTVDHADKNLKGLRCSMKPYIDQDWMENIPLYGVLGYINKQINEEL
ncbi:DUF1016 N-terminal domain-containing protein [uncultured Prevotella sp.]|uniref:DUF1016 N-terminal domain-containing protein n=1 Tax=uncultured Prevotella sp. TaxID=159272 RepID=UPI0025DCCF6B|nr:DUF1016 N-terminal domain-containing protein [uncultured Prevotella sp.]